MRWKFEGDERNAYKCCMCCHVRTGTIFLGLFHLMVHILVLALFAVVVLHPELMQENDSELYPTNPEDQLVVGSDQATALPVNTDNFSYGNYQMFRERHWTSEDKFVGMLITMGSFFVTIMLIYGAIKGHASYLMPFFCIQVFDFCVSCLTIVGYFSYMPDIKKWISMQPDMPFKDELLSLDADFLMLMAVIFFVFILTVKAYFVGVVWACYRYLTNSGHPSSNLMRRYETTGGDDSEMLLPPKYEDAVRMAAEQPPPPPYAAT